MDSLWEVAKDFGVISPKSKIKMVKIPVAIPAPLLPSSFVATTVAIEDAEIFTMLFPIKIVLKSFGESAVNFSTRLARLLPVSA